MRAYLNLPPPPTGSPRPRRNRRGSGRPYSADAIEQVRVLITGTTWPQAVIAAQVGVGTATVHGWKVRRGWQRPPGVPVSMRKVALSRAGFTRRCREALRRIERLAAREVLRLREGTDPDRLDRAVAAMLRARAAARAVAGQERR
jgi:hypothetical protein